MNTGREIRLAIKQGMAATTKNTKYGTYPHDFYKKDKSLQDVSRYQATNASLKIFPLINGRKPYGDPRNEGWRSARHPGPPGPDRVAFEPSGRYVGVLTHNGMPKNEFRPCDEYDTPAELIRSLEVFPGQFRNLRRPRGTMIGLPRPLNSTAHQGPSSTTTFSTMKPLTWSSSISLDGPGGLFPVGSGFPANEVDPNHPPCPTPDSSMITLTVLFPFLFSLLIPARSHCIWLR